MKSVKLYSLCSLMSSSDPHSSILLSKHITCPMVKSVREELHSNFNFMSKKRKKQDGRHSDRSTWIRGDYTFECSYFTSSVTVCALIIPVLWVKQPHKRQRGLSFETYKTNLMWCFSQYDPGSVSDSCRLCRRSWPLLAISNNAKFKALLHWFHFSDLETMVI